MNKWSTDSGPCLAGRAAGTLLTSLKIWPISARTGWGGCKLKSVDPRLERRLVSKELLNTYDNSFFGFKYPFQIQLFLPVCAATIWRVRRPRFGGSAAAWRGRRMPSCAPPEQGRVVALCTHFTHSFIRSIDVRCAQLKAVKRVHTRGIYTTQALVVRGAFETVSI